jgi:hypothetical protein
VFWKNNERVYCVLMLLLMHFVCLEQRCLAAGTEDSSFAGYSVRIEHGAPSVFTHKGSAGKSTTPAAKHPPSNNRTAQTDDERIAGGSATSYTSRIQKAAVPFTSRPATLEKQALPSSQALVHTILPPVRHEKIILSGEVGAQQVEASIGIDSGSDEILKHSPEIQDVRTAFVLDNTFRKWLQKTHAKVGLSDGKKVVVFKGKWDHAEHVLHSFGIPFNAVGNDQLRTALSAAVVLVVNCPGNVDDQGLIAINQFVSTGGCLLTTDWALERCLERACPGYIEFGGAYSLPELADAVCVDQSSKLFNGAPPYSCWQLDPKSEIVKLTRSTNLDVLVRSKALSKEDPQGLGILAVKFNYGRGRVLHLVGHFNNNTNLAFPNAVPDPIAGINISLRQVIAANFILDALERNEEQLTLTPTNKDSPVPP